MATIRAIYEDGQIRLLDEVDLEEGQKLKIEVIEDIKKSSKRIPNLHKGSFVVSDDFDEPLPDSFWLGEEE